METVLRGQSFAVEISGVDLSRDLSNAEFDEIKRIWLEHKIAVFRGQEIGDDALVAFTERFGPLFVHFRSQFNDQTRPEIMLISNIKEDGRNLGELGDGDLMWHSDQAYSELPVFSTLLYGIEVPNEGGGTWFCDTAGAYAALPECNETTDCGIAAEFLGGEDGDDAEHYAQRRAAPDEAAGPASAGPDPSAARPQVVVSQPGPHGGDQRDGRSGR